MTIQNPSIDEGDIIDHLIQHGEGLREELRPFVKMFLQFETLYLEIPEVFQEAYEEFLLKCVFDYLTDTLRIEYNQLETVVDFPTIIKLWKLDERGRNV